VPTSSLPLYGVPGRLSRRLAAVVIGSQALAVFFGALVARSLASAEGRSSANQLMALGSVTAVLCILDAGLLRRHFGVTLGWLLQLATLAAALIVPFMLIVGLLFLALWITALVQGHRLDLLETEATEAADSAARRTVG
jgi:hypothetical protein